MGKRKHFSQEFKLEAVRLVESGSRPAAELARQLGIAHNRLYKWQEQVRRNGTAAFPGSGKRRGSGDEIERLRRELERVKEGRDILKKAAASVRVSKKQITKTWHPATRWAPATIALLPSSGLFYPLSGIRQLGTTDPRGDGGCLGNGTGLIFSQALS
jgi:transposase